MDNKIKENIKARQEYNLKLLDLIMEQVDRHPELRFGQILCNLGILQYDYNDQKQPVIDPFFDESKEIYERIMYKS